MSERPRDLRAAERAITALRSIRQVVQAIWTLARAQQPRVEAAIGDAAEYLAWIEALVGRFGEPPAAAAPGSVLWVLAGPERPFCGGLARRLLEQVPAEGPLLVCGRRLADALPERGPLRERVVASRPAATGPEEIDAAARSVAAALLELGHAGPVHVLHPAGGGSELHGAALLTGAALRERTGPETYSGAEALLAAAVHEMVSGRLVVAMAEALRSEVRARLLAADAARQGCDRKLDELAQHWRVLRQEAITGEILELFSSRLAST